MNRYIICFLPSGIRQLQNVETFVSEICLVHLHGYTSPREQLLKCCILISWQGIPNEVPDLVGLCNLFCKYLGAIEHVSLVLRDTDSILPHCERDSLSGCQSAHLICRCHASD